MFKLTLSANVFHLAENFSKLNLMSLLGVGILLVSPTLQFHPIPFCFYAWPVHSGIASPWPLKVVVFAIPDPE